MIISGGVNIYPQEAENVLVTHPKVIDVAVFGVPNDDFGEEVKAVVQPADMRRRRAARWSAELIAYCRAQLADVKCPRIDRLPRRAPAPPHRQALQAAAARTSTGPGHGEPHHLTASPPAFTRSSKGRRHAAEQA